jgi:HPt (histidine-containing phosphotransfer) domain-containing protein
MSTNGHQLPGSLISEEWTPMLHPGLSRALEEALARLGGQWEVLLTLCRMFMVRCPKERAELVSALRRGDAVGVARTAHRLRGAVAQVSTGRPFELCGDLEQLASAGDLEAVAERLPELDDELAALMRELSAVVERGAPQ